MQELEKILEEIEKGTHTFELLGRDVDFVAIDWVRDVIRKYMNDDNEIMEQCPYCENEAALHWDVEKDGHQVFCPNCGKPMMLCSMCDARDGAVCDWKEGEGCKHSDERYRDYFRKHMNDGWNPANKPPETGRRCLVKMKHHAWISDYDSNFVLESEKIYHAEYVEICEAIYQDNDRWTYCDLQDGECTAYTNPKEYPGMPIDEVLEWQYMPHLQPETCKYTGGSCCWPIDQCGECPNNPERSDNHDGE